MRIHRQPTVYVLARPNIDWKELGRFLSNDAQCSWSSSSSVPSEVLCEVAGRVCYMSFSRPRPGGNAAYLQHIKASGHGSVLEHASWTFLITGVSRSLTHELIRHRHFSFSQLSQRYVDESVADYVEPDIFAQDEELHAVWEEAIRHAHAAYLRLTQLLAQKQSVQSTETIKQIRQAARSVLPNATETKIVVSANARALRHFLEQRGSRHAEPEIRKLANQILEVLKREAPNLFGDYTTFPLEDGTAEICTSFQKV